MPVERLVTGIVSLVIIAVSVYFLLWIDRPGIRYTFNGNSICYPRQMVRLPETVDFVAIGSSRVRRGLDPILVETASDGKITNAFNLGRPRRNTARSYVMFRDALERSPNIKYAYIELATNYFFEDLRPEYVRFDVGVLRYQDIIDIHDANAEQSLFFRTQRVVLNSIEKVEGALIALLSGRLSEYYVGPGKEVENICWRRHFDTVQGEDQRDKDRRLVAARKGYDDYATARREPEMSFSRPRAVDELFYASKIRALAAERGVTVVFGKHWAIYEPPLSDEAARTIQARIPEYISPPPELVRASWDGFIDDKHMGPDARDAFTRWVLSELLARDQAS